MKISTHVHSTYLEKAEAESLYARNEDLEKSNRKSGRIGLKGITAVISKKNAISSLPLSAFITYEVSDWEELGTSSVAFFNNYNAIFTNPIQTSGFRFMFKNANKRLSFICGNLDSTPQGRRYCAEYTCDLPVGRHTLGVCAGGTLLGGTVKQLTFWLDGKLVGAGVTQAYTLQSTDISTAGNLLLNTNESYANYQCAPSSLSICIERPLIVNFDMSASDSPYTPSEYDVGEPPPLFMRMPASEKRTIIELSDCVENRFWRDISGNGNNAVFLGEPFADKKNACAAMSTTWEWSANVGAYVFGDTEVIPADSTAKILARVSSGSETTFSFGKSPTESEAYFGGIPIGSEWTNVGEFFGGTAASKLFVTPSSGNVTIDLALITTNLKQ